MVSREKAAAACLDVLDGPFLKALAESTRIEILRILILNGRSDVGTIAGKLPQDRSVIARHLQVLERANVLKSSTEGRHTYYELDGAGVLRQAEALVTLFQRLTPICCPK